MASPQSSQWLAFWNKFEQWFHDPAAGAAAEIVTPDGGTTKRIADLRDYEIFAVMATCAALTGAGMTRLEIVANDKADFSGTTVVIKDSGVIAADAVGDWALLECTAQEVCQEGEDAGVGLRYVAGRITMANAADKAIVTYVRAKPRFPTADLTPATTIAA